MGRNNKDQEILGKIKHSYERSIVSQIKTIVANYYNVPLEIFASKSRKREVITTDRPFIRSFLMEGN